MFATSRNETELKHAWVAWREASGNKYRQQYLDFIEINQEGARSLGFEDLQEQWLERYETEDFSALIQKVWTEPIQIDNKNISLELFYKQFHAYVRTQLREFYSNQVNNFIFLSPCDFT
jgi:hypothetical protein